MSSIQSKTHRQIAVKPPTYFKLKELGEMGDSFDTVINRLLEKSGVPVS